MAEIDNQALAATLMGVPITNRDRLRISRNAMAGREPTPYEQAQLAADMPRLEQNSENLAALTGVPETVRSIGDAYRDPSLANVTYAGTQAAMQAFRPTLAAALMAGGLGAAGARDLLSGGSAQAKSRGKDANAEAKAANAKAGLAKAEAATAKAKAEAELAILNATNAAQAAEAQRRKEEADSALAREQQKVKDAEDAAARGRANAAYAEGLKTERRFSDTETGKIFDKFGPLAPGAVGATTGAVTGAGLRGMGVASKAALYGVPAALGTLSGTASAHWPLAYESAYAPTVNPSYQAAQNYIREAPAGDARAAQLKGLLEDGTINQQNPVRAEAEKNLYDPTKFTERSILGAVEGVAGGLAGSEALPAAKYLIKNAPKAVYEAAKAPGAAVRGLMDGYGAAAPTASVSTNTSKVAGGGGQTGNAANSAGSYARYPSTSDPTRQDIRNLYREQTLARGEPLDPQTFSNAVKQGFESKGLKFPLIEGRVNKTNEAIQAFVQQNGRMPVSNQEWAQFVFRNRGTLGLPASVGLAAALMNQPSEN